MSFRYPTAAESLAAIVAAERAGNLPLAFRQFIQLADDLEAVDAARRAELSAEPPTHFESHWYAAVAALVEYRLAAVGAPLPDWVVECEGLAEPWVVAPDDTLSGELWQPVDVPEPFARRGVLLEAGELVSV